MADLSGLCSTHGIAVFNSEDALAAGTEIETGRTPEGEPDVWPPKWYWATCQHNVLTGKPNGPYPHRSAALGNAAMIMAAYESDAVLQGSDLG